LAVRIQQASLSRKNLPWSSTQGISDSVPLSPSQFPSKIAKASWVWWCTPVIPAIQEPEAGESWIQGPFGLQSETLSQKF
jgi:hypothetical protein